MFLDSKLMLQDRLDSKYVFLVVEAVETMRRVTVDQLRHLGAEKVLVAQDGGDALRILNSQTVHVVLAELDMPGMSGIELLRELRAHERLFAIPFLMTTARPDRACVQEAIVSGVTGVLLKPYSRNQLVQRLQSALVWKPRKTASPDTTTVATSPTPAKALVPADTASHEPPMPDPVLSVDLPAFSGIGEPTGDRPTLLLVDDAPDNLLVLSELLKDEYRITLARDGARALEICCSDTPPDLVLLDIMMPDMDGFEVAMRMREHPNAETIPVIFVTAMTSTLARDRGLDLGAVDFITKPIDPNQLKPRIRNFMRYIQLRRDQQADYDHMLEVAELRDEMKHVSRQDLQAPLSGLLGVVQALLAKNSLSPQDQQQLQQAQALAQQALELIGP